MVRNRLEMKAQKGYGSVEGEDTNAAQCPYIGQLCGQFSVRKNTRQRGKGIGGARGGNEQRRSTVVTVHGMLVQVVARRRSMDGIL
jgi:hypothetical protein